VLHTYMHMCSVSYTVYVALVQGAMTHCGGCEGQRAVCVPYIWVDCCGDDPVNVPRLPVGSACNDKLNQDTSHTSCVQHEYMLAMVGVKPLFHIPYCTFY
jgi:hypothetical protein